MALPVRDRSVMRGAVPGVRRLVASTLGAVALTLAAPTGAAPRAATGPVTLYIGTRAGGPGTGIAAARFDPATGTLRALGVQVAASHPTWLVADRTRPILYAVREVGNDGKADGAILSFAADPASGALRATGSAGSGGGGPTFLALDRRALLVANYGTGDVAALALDRSGVAARIASKQRDIGSGLTPRQASAHPHGIAIDPSGAHALVADLGADSIFIYRYDSATMTLAPAPTRVATPPGSMPRHIVFHPNGRFVYANAEATGDILSFRWDAATGTLTRAGTTPTRGPGYRGDLSSAEVAVAPDGRFLYVSNRGEDVLAVYAIDPATGALTGVQRIASGGAAPASFAFDPSGRWLLLANEGAGRVSVFRRDAATGRLTATPGGIAVADPTSIAFLPGRPLERGSPR